MINTNLLVFSVSHAGPIGASVRDVALGYVAMAGIDSGDVFTLVQPPAHLSGFNDLDLKNLKIGIYKEYNEDSHPLLAKAARDAADLLMKRGATLVDISLSNLEAIAKSHTVTILSEMSTLLDQHRSNLRNLSYSARVALALGKSTSSSDYISAQLVRDSCSIMCHYFKSSIRSLIWI